MRQAAQTSAPFGDGVRSPVPWSEEAELGVLGSVMADPDALPDVLAEVRPEAFYREANRRVYRAIRELDGRGDPVDVVTLAAELKASGDLEAAGGMPYLAQLVDAVPGAANVSAYTAQLRRYAILRQLIEAGAEIDTLGRETHPGDAEDALDRAEAAVFRVAEAVETGDLERAGDGLAAVLDEIEARREDPDALAGLPTGFGELDRLTDGLKPGTMNVLAGRPSMGKTALALNIAAHVALEDSRPAAVFSLEMGREELLKRLLASEALIPVGRLHRTRTEEEHQRLAEAAGRIRQAPLLIDDQAGLTPLEFRSRVRRAVRRNGVELVVLDYLQLMAGPPGAPTRREEVEAISRAVKVAAREVDVPILALSQLSRAPEQRSEHRPVLADLRETGAIEQDADLVVFVYRPEQYANPARDDMAEIRGKAELIVRKQRNGPTGTVRLRFEAAYTRFEEEPQPGL